jgi:diaminopropionate ammonia-lyase
MNPAMEDIKQQIGLDANSRVLCFSTEGDTDKENYRRVLWNGAYPSP